jgi:hypothetical protein
MGCEYLGCGAYAEGNRAQLRLPYQWKRQDVVRDITFLELVPILMALLIWALNYQNKKILFRTDNSALVSIIKLQT